MTLEKLRKLIAERASYYHLKNNDVFKVQHRNLASISIIGYETYLQHQKDKIVKNINNLILGQLWVLNGFIDVFSPEGLDWLLFSCEQLDKMFQKEPFSYEENIITRHLDEFLILYRNRRDIDDLLSTGLITSISLTQRLKGKLSAYDFFSLPKVKMLHNTEELVNLIAQNDTPYQIAMFDFLGFITSIQKNYSKDKTVSGRNTIVADILNKSTNAVKKNILTLNLLNQNTENFKARYTAHKYVEIVKNDYRRI